MPAMGVHFAAVAATTPFLVPRPDGLDFCGVVARSFKAVAKLVFFEGGCLRSL